MSKAPTIRPSLRSENVRYAVRDVLQTAEKARAAGRDMVYMNIGDPNQFDFVTPPHLVDAICGALRDNKTSYAPSEGLPAARQAIAEDAEQRLGIGNVCDVFVGNGGSECIEIALASLVDPGDNVLTPAPGYPLYTALLTKFGCPERAYLLDEANGWQPDVDDIASRIDARTRAIVLINPGNPTGTVCRRETLQRLADLAAERGIVIFADEIYDRLVFDGEHVSIASLQPEASVLTFNGLSKAFLGPGLRIGWCVASGRQRVVQPYVDAMHKFLRARLCASHPMQYAVAPAINGPQAHIADALVRVRRRRDVMLKAFERTELIRCVAPQAAFYAFPSLHGISDDAEFVRQLIEQTGVVVVPGNGFGQREGSAHFRVVFLAPEARLAEALERVVSFANGYKSL